MKSRATELLDRAILAMAAAIELYNKPGFPYRSESFSILAINAWELVIKAKWLTMHQNNQRSLYVYEHRPTKTGKSKRRYIKRTKSEIPFTRDIKYLGRKLVELQELDQTAWSHIEVLLEFRNNASHFYNQSPQFDARIHKVGAASVRNFAHVVDEWFNYSVEEFGIFLMPLTFFNSPSFRASFLKADEASFLAFLDSMDDIGSDNESPYTVAIDVELRFIRSDSTTSVAVKKSGDPSALSITRDEEEIRRIYPWDYSTLTERCRERYENFKVNKEYHKRRKELMDDDRFSHVRHLDPGNPKTSTKVLFNPNIMIEFDKHYSRQPT